jgi:hypothetical protein
MYPRNYLHVQWDDYTDRWRCWIFRSGQVVEREYLTDIPTVVARAQKLGLPVDVGGGKGDCVQHCARPVCACCPNTDEVAPWQAMTMNSLPLSLRTAAGWQHTGLNCGR